MFVGVIVGVAVRVRVRDGAGDWVDEGVGDMVTDGMVVAVAVRSGLDELHAVRANKATKPINRHVGK